MSFGEFDLGFPLPPEPTEDDFMVQLGIIKTVLDQLEQQLDGTVRDQLRKDGKLLSRLQDKTLKLPADALETAGDLEQKLRRKLATSLSVAAEAPAQTFARLAQVATGSEAIDQFSEPQIQAILDMVSPIAGLDAEPPEDVPTPVLSRRAVPELVIIGTTGGSVTDPGFGGIVSEVILTERPEEPSRPGQTIDEETGEFIPFPPIDEGGLPGEEQPPDGEIAIDVPPGEEQEEPPVPEQPGSIEPLPPTVIPDQVALELFCDQFPPDQRPSFCPPIRPQACPPTRPACPAPQIAVVPVTCGPDGQPIVQTEPGEPQQEPPLSENPPIVPGDLSAESGSALCEIDAYAPARESQFSVRGIGTATPLTDFIYGFGFNLDVYIAEQQRIFQATRLGWRPRDIWANLEAIWRRMVAQVVKRIDSGLGASIALTGCSSPRFISSQVGRAVVGFLSIIFGPALSKAGQMFTYQGNVECPVQFPDEAEALEAYRRGTITLETLKLWVEQNDHCWEPYQRFVDSQIDRVEPLMAIQMWRREQLTDEQFHEQIRKAGYTEDEWNDRWEEIAKFVPPVSDLVRFMVRDVEDTRLVEKFGLDDDFEEKYAGVVRKAGDFQGISEESFKRYWRAHWRIPSPGQLFDMFHRSRIKPDGDPLKTSMEDVVDALKQDDVLPFWIPRLIDTTFRRLSRVDARRAFETGAISEADLREQFTIIGYRDKDVDALVRWAKINRIRVLQNRPEVRLFRDGVFSRAQAQEAFAGTLIPPEDINRALDLAAAMGQRKFVNRCINAIRKRFLTGDLDLPGARAALTATGVPPAATDAILSSFECERDAKGKELSTSQLCQFLEQGLLDSLEFVERLRRVGWSEADAIRILTNCRSKISEKQAREAASQARREAAAIEKQRKEQQRIQREIERQRERNRKNLEKAERARNAREKLLQRSTAKLAQNLNVAIEFATACVQGVWRELTSDTVLTTDERVQTIVFAVERSDPIDCEDFRMKALALGRALEQYEDLSEDQMLQVFASFTA